MREPAGDGESREPFERWIDAARRGSDDALGAMFEASRTYLLLVANAELASDLRAKGGASDLVQETFLEAQRDFARFRGKTEPQVLAWLRRILVNNLANFARRYRKSGKRRLEQEWLATAGSAVPTSGAMPADSNTPSRLVAANEQAETLERALAGLPALYVQVIRMRNWERLPFEKIGRELHRSADAVRMLWYRALRRLKQDLERTK